MVRQVAIAVFLAGTALAVRGFYIWTGCGYDCPALPYLGITATAAMIYGVLAAALGLLMVIVSWLGSKGNG